MSSVACSNCGAILPNPAAEPAVSPAADPAAGETAALCSQCASVGLPENSPLASFPTSSDPLCATCQSPIDASETKVSCPDCNASYHRDCWEEVGGCAIYGCPSVPSVEPRKSAEIPVSFWGQENKPCPSCGNQILAAAMRCRHCGATFASARPEDSLEFAQRQEREKKLPALRQIAVWSCVFSILPLTAPLGATWTLLWYLFKRRDVKALPSLYPALCKIGIVVGFGQSLILVLMALLHHRLRPF